MIALVRLSDSDITILPRDAGAWRLEIPGTSITVSPVAVGWEAEGYRIAAVTRFTPPEGKVVSGAPSYALDGDDVVETYEVVDAPSPVEHCIQHYGYARGGYVSGSGMVVKDMSQNIGGMTRVSTGRYRIHDIAADASQMVCRAVSYRDANFLLYRVSAYMPTYVEVRFSNVAGQAVDPAEVVIEIDKVFMQ